MTEEKKRQLLIRWLEGEEQDYDSQTGLLKKAFSSPGYHTKLRGGSVHQTRENMMYASALFDSGTPSYIERGKKIALKIAALQDKEEASPTYGIWSWFYEEPLEEMDPPDWNWADFLGKEFLFIVMRHGELFSEEEQEILEDTIRRACQAIRKRDVEPDYTNISVMGTYVTCIAGEYYRDEEILCYGKERLRKIHGFNMAYHNFAEYNSPTYTVTAAEDLARFYRDIRWAEGKSMVYDLLKIAWKTILTHFHHGSGQWSGPHGRCYRAFLSEEIQAKLQYATGGRMCFMKEGEMEKILNPECFRTGIVCFPEFLEEFFPDCGRAFFRESFKRCGELSIASLYQCREFSLGSFYKNEMWIQRDNVIAYFGTKEQPVMMKLQCLHDFYDFSGAQIGSVQKDGTVLSVVNFATDGGDTHPSLDRIKDGTITAEDIRIRLKLTGSLEQIRDYGLREGNQFYFGTDRVQGRFDVLLAAFGEQEIRYEINRIDKGEAGNRGNNTNVDHMDRLAFDIVLYHGKPIEINLSELEHGVCGMVLRMKETESFGEDMECRRQEGRLILKVKDHTGTALEVSTGVKPGRVKELRRDVSGTLGSVKMEEAGNGRGE